jgi:large subunit ribosomal protein L32
MVPTRRVSKARKRKRRSHHARTPVNFAICPNCNQAKLPHAVCGNCGWHNGKIVLPQEEEK